MKKEEEIEKQKAFIKRLEEDFYGVILGLLDKKVNLKKLEYKIKCEKEKLVKMIKE